MPHFGLCAGGLDRRRRLGVVACTSRDVDVAAATNDNATVACEIIGAAPALEIDGVLGVFALRAADDAPAFALHTADIRPRLSAALRRLL